jgi:AcrR family transcriptional regulator
MEENVAISEKQTGNRQVQKTQKLLQEALARLIREKNYDSITIKEILDLANVGRSTFYTHFLDKDDLLVSCIQDMLRSVHAPGIPSSAKRYERMICFSFPVFDHIYHHLETDGSKLGTRGRAIVHKHLENVIADLISDDVRDALQGRQKTAGPVSPELLVRYVATTFTLVLNWWVESRNPLTPKDANEMFRALILPTLDVTLV